MDAGKNNILFYSKKLAEFEYGESHPFKPERSKHLLELLNRYSLLNEANQQVLEPVRLSELFIM